MKLGQSVLLGVGTIATVGAVAWLVRRHESHEDSAVPKLHVEKLPLPTTTTQPAVPTIVVPAPAPPAIELPAPTTTTTTKPPKPAVVDPALPPPNVITPPKSGLVTYVVKSGDTLWAIARRHDTTAAAIASASSIAVDSIIRPGQELQVPVGEHAAPAPTNSPTPTPVSPKDPSSPTNGHVGLTFDDGPNGQYTEAILSTLNRMNVNATFFVIGKQVAANPALVARIATSGNEIGNHSWDHSDLTTLSDAAIRDQLERTSNAVQDATGRRPTTFRPPYGAVNDSVRGAAAAENLRVVMWTIDTEDWTRPGTAAIASAALSGARDGSIILMHDGGGNRSQTVAAVEQVVNGLRARGLEPVPVSEM